MKSMALARSLPVRTVLAAAVLGLAGCGSLNAAPAPLAGDLLSAPTTLNLNGQVLKVAAQPQLSGTVFSVRVRVAAGSAAPNVSSLKVMGMYAITNSGVWKAPRMTALTSGCAAQLCARGSGGAGDLQSGERTQIVTELQDGQGRTYWLRDARTRAVK